MPIRESERKRYPRNWPEIALKIRDDRAGWFCECLGECDCHDGWCLARNGRPHPVTGSKVVLTVAHLDHTPENVQPDNLRAMCQRVPFELRPRSPRRYPTRNERIMT